MFRTKDQVAQEFLAEGRRRGVASVGVVMCVAAGLVESELTVYANSKVPESLALPHDAVGCNGFSVGPLQQQVCRGAGGHWWWGDAKTCMDPTLSSGLFYARLAKLDYTGGSHTPGWYVQQVQQSAYPDRYDSRIDEARAIYDRLTKKGILVPAPARPDFNEYWVESPNSQSRNGTPINLFLLHTQEGGGGDSAADTLAHYLADPASQVSYHYTVSQAADGGVTVCDVVDTDLASWSVLSANDRSINLCFAGSRASWSRLQWMSQARAIDVAAYLAVLDCYKYSIPPTVITPPYTAGRAGISDHDYVTEVLKEGTHTDVGANFPWDYFTTRVTFWATGGHGTPEAETTEASRGSTGPSNAAGAGA